MVRIFQQQGNDQFLKPMIVNITVLSWYLLLKIFLCTWKFVEIFKHYMWINDLSIYLYYVRIFMDLSTDIKILQQLPCS